MKSMKNINKNTCKSKKKRMKIKFDRKKLKEDETWKRIFENDPK